MKIHKAALSFLLFLTISIIYSSFLNNFPNIYSQVFEVDENDYFEFDTKPDTDSSSEQFAKDNSNGGDDEDEDKEEEEGAAAPADYFNWDRYSMMSRRSRLLSRSPRPGGMPLGAFSRDLMSAFLIVSGATPGAGI